MRHHPAIALLILLTFLGSACSTLRTQRELSNVAVMGVDDLESPTHDRSFAMLQYTPDPIEGFNRGSLSFTKGAIDWVMKPVAKGWRFVLPEPARQSVENFSYNLAWPVRTLSLVLQGRPSDSWRETLRFLINTTGGLLGFFDPATSVGLPTYREDFGQAFASWGAGPGFYLTIPVLGPSSGRDALGRVFDAALNPATYVLGGNLLFSVNAFSFRIDGYEALTASEPELYLPVRAVWSIQRSIAVSNYEIPAEAYATSDPEPSLGVLLLGTQDPAFPGQAEVVPIEMPNTGQVVPASVWVQPEPAPMLYLIPGIGAHRRSTTVVALAEMAWNRGYSVAIVTSPFHREFLVNGLSHPYPGYTPSDAADLHDFFTRLHAELEARHPGQLGSARLLGYSMGAIESLHIAANPRPGALTFERVVAVNPPVDLPYAAREFDAYFDAPLRWPAAERDRRVLEIGQKAFLVAQEGLDGQPLPFDRTESEFLVGLSGRNTIINTLAAIEERTGQAIPFAEGEDPGRGPLLAIVNQSSLENYADRLAVPYFMAQGMGASREELVHGAGLRSLEGALGGDERIRVVHNADDFLLGSEGRSWLKATLGERLTLFPGGGHLGNLVVPEVQEAIFRALAGPGVVAEAR